MLWYRKTKVTARGNTYFTSIETKFTVCSHPAFSLRAAGLFAVIGLPLGQCPALIRVV